MEVYKYIVKWEGGRKSGNPVLFFPESSANPGRIVCYAHMGQHSEACLTYYWGLRNPSKRDLAQQDAVLALVREYEGFMESGETMQRVYRDNRLMRAAREVK